MRLLVILVAICPALATTGCKDEGKPNSELKIPDVPVSNSSVGKGDMSKDKKK